VCEIPKYGSESDFQKPNRIVPNYFSNSKKDGEARKLPTNCGAVCLLLIQIEYRVFENYNIARNVQNVSQTGLNTTDYIDVCGDNFTLFLIEQQAICGTMATDCVKIVYHTTRPPNIPSSKYQIRNEMFFLSVY